jgi:molecular chaperone DnaK
MYADMQAKQGADQAAGGGDDAGTGSDQAAGGASRAGDDDVVDAEVKEVKKA